MLKDRKRMCTLIIILITILEMLSLFKIVKSGWPIAVCGIALVDLAFGIISPNLKKMVTTFIAAGFFLNIYTNQPLASWIAGINYMLNITAILVVMQLFTIPIKLGHYTEALHYMILKKFKSVKGIYAFSILIIHLFSSFLLFGTIPVMISLIGGPLEKIIKNYKKFMSTALTRGYAVVVMWAPGAVNILLVMDATGSKWTDIFLVGFIIALLGLVLSYFMETRGQHELLPSIDLETDLGQAKTATKKIFNIVLVVTFLILLIYFIDWLQIINNNTGRVLLAGLILAVAWIGFYLKSEQLHQALHEYLNVNLIKTVDLSVLYVSLGVFSKALETSGLLALSYSYVEVIAHNTGIFLIPIISIIVLALSMVGLHPFIILVALGHILTDLHLGFSPAILSLALMFGATISYMTSPFAGIVLTTSKFLDLPINTVSTKWNGTYCFIYFFIGNAIIMAWSLYH